MRVLKKVTLLTLLFFSAVLLADSNNPFYLACTDKAVETDHLDTGFFSFKIPEIDKYNRVTSLTLLNRLIQKVETKITGTETLLRNILYCIDNQEDKKCSELVYWMYMEIPKYVKKARFHAALAQSPHNLSTWRGKAEDEINIDLSIWSIHKLTPWEDLTSDEAFIAKTQLTKYKNQTKNKLDELVVTQDLSKEKYDEYYKRTMLDIRYRHYLEYQSMLGSVHLLQYLRSPVPNISDVYMGLKELNDNLEKEKQYVAKKKLEFEVINSTTMLTSNSILEFLNYRSLLEELLLENPRYCNLAAAITKYRGRRYIKQALTIALPIMVGSMFMPPLSGLAVGVLTGAGFAGHTQHRLNHQVEINMSKIYGDESGIELLEVSNTKKQRDFDVAIMPIGLGVMGSGSSKLGKVLIRSSGKLSTKLTKNSTNYKEILSFTRLKEKFSIKLIQK